MKSKAACISVLVRFVIFSIAVSGCSQTPTASLTAVKTFHLDVSSTDIQTLDVQAYQDGEELVVSGRVRRRCNFCYEDVRGHVDIALLGPDGSVLATGSTFYSPRSIPKTGSRSSSFLARLPVIAGGGVAICTAYHEELDPADSASGTKTFQCRSNAAARTIRTARLVKEGK